jgi:predicted SprT family Zn-dependent metalloprotease
MPTLLHSRAHLRHLPGVADLQLLFARLNAQHFGGVLRAHRIVFNRRLTSVAGRIAYRAHTIELSAPLLSRHPDHLEATLLHEMVHAWLYERGLPNGHGAHFRHKMREVGLTSIYHHMPVSRGPRSTRRYLLVCPRCGTRMLRRRRPSGRVSCARCSPRRFSARVELQIQRIA